MTRSFRGPSIALALALVGCQLSACSLGEVSASSSTSPGSSQSSDETELAELNRSEEAKKVLSSAMGGGGFSPRVTNTGYQDERTWRLVYEGKTHSFLSGSGGSNTDSYEYSYDDQGRLTGCTECGDGVVVREDSWAYDGSSITRTTCDYEKDPAGAITKVVTDQGDNGGSVETTYDGSGEIVQSTEITCEKDDEGYTRTLVRRDSSGVVDFTQVNRYNADDHLTSSTSYDGEPSELTLESESAYLYDEQGRDTDSFSEYPGYEYGSQNRATHTAYAQDGASATLSASGLQGGYNAEMVTFTVTDADGLVLRRYHNLSANEFSSVAPSNCYATYDEDGNPTKVVVEQGYELVSKCLFNYDENGNLLSAADADFNNGELRSVTYHVFQYENVLTGERTEVPSLDAIQVPELVGEDADLALNRYGEGPLDRVMYGEGQWQVELESDEFGARKLVIDCLNFAPGQSSIVIATAHEGGMAVEDESIGHYESMENGEVLLVTYTGARFSLSEATEDTVRVRGTMADGTEVDATASWFPDNY